VLLDPNGEVVHTVSAVSEHGESLFLGSLAGDFVSVEVDRRARVSSESRSPRTPPCMIYKARRTDIARASETHVTGKLTHVRHN